MLLSTALEDSMNSEIIAIISDLAEIGLDEEITNELDGFFKRNT